MLATANYVADQRVRYCDGARPPDGGLADTGRGVRWPDARDGLGDPRALVGGGGGALQIASCNRGGEEACVMLGDGEGAYCAARVRHCTILVIPKDRSSQLGMKLGFRTRP